VINHGASRAAVELAVIDCALRAADASLGACLPPRRPVVTYSGVITAGSVDGARKRARQMKVMGLPSIKVKVGLGDDLERLRAVREVVGPSVSLRIDANGAWRADQAAARLDELAPLGLAAAEQPIPRGDPAELAALRRRAAVPIMVDESLVTEADADALIAAGACDLFNVRLSKHGGLGPSLAIAERARRAGIAVQVGSQVGETAILSAAGRHLAASLPEVAFVEGSFGALLLAQDVARDSVSFGFGGEAPLLRGPGLGIDVVTDRLRAHARQVIEL
jgi:muconate cycloisomerase